MSILTYPLGFIGGGKEFYNGVMENSLRFNDDDSPYLVRTPSSTGNQKIWTFSAWIKRGTGTGSGTGTGTNLTSRAITAVGGGSGTSTTGQFVTELSIN